MKDDKSFENTLTRAKQGIGSFPFIELFEKEEYKKYLYAEYNLLETKSLHRTNIVTVIQEVDGIIKDCIDSVADPEISRHKDFERWANAIVTELNKIAQKDLRKNIFEKIMDKGIIWQVRTCKYAEDHTALLRLKYLFNGLDSILSREYEKTKTGNLQVNDPGYIIDLTYTAVFYDKYNGIIWDKMELLDFISCFDLNNNSRSFPKFIRGKKNKFIRFLSKINTRNGICYVNDEIALANFGINNYRKGKNDLNRANNTDSIDTWIDVFFK